MFSVSSLQSVRLHLLLTLSGLLQTDSLWLNSQQTAELSSQSLFLYFFLSTLVPDKVHVRASDIGLDLFQTCQNTPFGLHNLFFSPLFLFFLLSFFFF